MEGACLVEESVFLAAQGLLRRTRGQRGHWPLSSLTHAEPCHLVLPIMGSGWSCGTGDMGRGVSSQLSPMVPALLPLVAPWAVLGGIRCLGCSRAPKDLGTCVCQAQLGTGTPWELTAAWLGGEGVSASSLAQIDRKTEGMIHVSGCGLRAKTGVMFDVRMPAGAAAAGAAAPGSISPPQASSAHAVQGSWLGLGAENH